MPFDPSVLSSMSPSAVLEYFRAILICQPSPEGERECKGIILNDSTAVVVTVLVGEVNSSGGDGEEGWKSSYSFNLGYLGKEAMLSFDAIFPPIYNQPG